MLFEIKSRWNGSVLFRVETESIRLAVEKAVKSGASLDGANLNGANLNGASLDRANLTPIRDDIWAVLCSAPAEVAGLRMAIINGRIDGSTYEGSCCCLVGTLANTRHCHYGAIPTLTPNSIRPAERFFAAIRPGDTPETSQFSKLALEWIDLWLLHMRVAFAVPADQRQG